MDNPPRELSEIERWLHMCSDPEYAVYGRVEFLGCDEPDATGLAGSVGHLGMDPDKAASNQGGSDLLLHKSFMTEAAPYAVTLGYSDSNTCVSQSFEALLALRAHLPIGTFLKAFVVSHLFERHVQDTGLHSESHVWSQVAGRSCDSWLLQVPG